MVRIGRGICRVAARINRARRARERISLAACNAGLHLARVCEACCGLRHLDCCPSDCPREIFRLCSFVFPLRVVDVEKCCVRGVAARINRARCPRERVVVARRKAILRLARVDKPAFCLRNGDVLYRDGPIDTLLDRCTIAPLVVARVVEVYDGSIRTMRVGRLVDRPVFETVQLVFIDADLLFAVIGELLASGYLDSCRGYRPRDYLVVRCVIAPAVVCGAVEFRECIVVSRIGSLCEIARV